MLGKTVFYKLSASDAENINRRRVDPRSVRSEEWPKGAQAHYGNTCEEGQIYPALVVRLWPNSELVQLQVFLDGNDTYWAASRKEGREVAQFSLYL